jgi:hypothetical protein
MFSGKNKTIPLAEIVLHFWTLDKKRREQLWLIIIAWTHEQGAVPHLVK